MFFPILPEKDPVKRPWQLADELRLEAEAARLDESIGQLEAVGCLGGWLCKFSEVMHLSPRLLVIFTYPKVLRF